ncbi:polyprenyl synthetase family protein [Fluviispira multicolorata]|uniref:Octaprenyl diphosphate synthase n=1 Tax=Fluviispira multicolorata TaxID=2654512 RepID=A0A833JFA1_9BACT|nr:polyprenyl synthetase family protein [Fluviispira multicolorata]KAB8030940.1 octaprenyl diphosphate synthase [Fluviispira multicolorata]
MIPTFFQPISNELSALEKKLIDFLLTPNKPTNQVLEHIFSSGGKRIRPALFLLCAKLINYDGEHKFSIASVCEYIHTASLLHDDVIDSSTLRRNKPTINSVWGDETAVLTGDLIYSAACRLMVKTKNLELIDDFAECIRFMSESELFQLELLWQIDTTYAQYERVISGKTANLFLCSTKTPCYLANSDKLTTQLLGEYGEHIGLAFQIFDDYLDYAGEEIQVGKPIAADLLEGKITLPLIYALNSNNQFAQKLKNLVNKIIETNNASSDEKHELIKLVKETEGLSKSLKRAEFHAEKARNCLIEYSKNKELNSEQRIALKCLLEITYFVLNRKS